MNSTDAKKPIRLGMFLIGGEHWRGGLNYQKSILQILEGPLADRFEAQLFLTHEQFDLASDAFAGLLHLPPIVDDSIFGFSSKVGILPSPGPFLREAMPFPMSQWVS